MDIVVLGAGPAGLSAALALSIQSSADKLSKISIKVLEIRPALQTIGGTINMTPLAMRYLDHLGAAKHIRPQSIELKNGLDYISLRTGKSLGNIWANIGCARVIRQTLTQSLYQTIQEEHSETIKVQWNKKVVKIEERNAKVILTLEDGDKIEADAVIGADGLHSVARSTWVEPSRVPRYSGYVTTMGWGDKNVIYDTEPFLSLSDGSPALRDTTLLSGANGILLVSYWEQTRTKLYFAHVHKFGTPDTDNSRDVWKALADDQEALKKEVSEAYDDGQVKGVKQLLSSCEKWQFWPINILPGKGKWHMGRVLLIGDAAHAMPPQGESTGFAIEDAVLVGHVFSRRDSRDIETMFRDFETLRKAPIDKHYDDAVWSMDYGLRKSGWLMGIVMEWITWAVLLHKRWNQTDHFSSDVRSLKLPD